MGQRESQRAVWKAICCSLTNCCSRHEMPITALAVASPAPVMFAQLNVGVMLLRQITISLVLTIALSNAAIGAEARACEWQQTKLKRVECFLETGTVALGNGNAQRASGQFLNGLRWLGDEYLTPDGSPDNASFLLTKAALERGAGNHMRAAAIYADVLRSGVIRLREEQ